MFALFLGIVVVSYSVKLLRFECCRREGSYVLEVIVMGVFCRAAANRLRKGGV